MKTTLFILAILLLLSLIGNWYFGTSARNNLSTRLAENKRLQDTITVNKTRALNALATVKRLEDERMEMRDSVKVAQNARNAEIKAYKVRLSKLRPEVAPRLDSVPVLRDFVALQDSIIAKQDSLIHGMELAHSAEIVNLESQLEEKGKEAMAERLQKDAWRQAAENAEKDVTKANKKVTFWKVVSAVAGGVIAILLLKP